MLMFLYEHELLILMEVAFLIKSLHSVQLFDEIPR